ncbi:MAG: type II toxin-antitoxin system RelB/DinJ family antitoxin [Akkermansiaceae bacterium]|nr:type II toxin-antitoxin system RelB/DinJ family antitoxin [Akkermansiaceae bacterium]
MKKAPVKLQVRMDRQLKEAAEEIFSEIGIDATTAVRMFFTKVAKTRSIPFALKAEPEFTPEQEKQILAAAMESEDPANLIGPYSNAADLIASLRNHSSTTP